MFESILDYSTFFFEEIYWYAIVTAKNITANPIKSNDINIDGLPLPRKINDICVVGKYSSNSTNSPVPARIIL